MKSHPAFDSWSCPFSSQNRFLPLRAIDTFVCMPLPLMPVTGLGRKQAVISIRAATWRDNSLYSCTWSAAMHASA
jgi:hypothetical protein